jgi:hypothetical protein
MVSSGKRRSTQSLREACLDLFKRLAAIRLNVRSVSREVLKYT